MSHKIRLQEGEELIHRGHFHWSWILPFLFQALIAFFLFAGLIYLAPGYFLNTTTGRIITLAYILGVFLYIFLIRKMDSMSSLTITSHRVIRVDRNRFLHGFIIEIPFDQIENVRSSMYGFWGTILKFGTIEIYTAGDEGQIMVGHHLVDPVHVASIILKHRGEYLKVRNLNGAESHGRQNSYDSSYQNQPQNVVGYMPAMQPFYQPAEHQHRPVEGFVDQKLSNTPKTAKCKDSYLLKLLAESDEFKDGLVGSLVEDISGENSSRGKRLVKTITSHGDFKRKVVGDLTKELLE